VAAATTGVDYIIGGFTEFFVLPTTVTLVAFLFVPHHKRACGA
jgi:hypothetical protein